MSPLRFGGLALALGLCACAGGPADEERDTDMPTLSGLGDDGRGETTTGLPEADGSSGESTGPSTDPSPAPEIRPTFPGLRRLTRREIDQTLQDLLGGQTSAAMTHLPAEASGRYDNDVDRQSTSQAFVQGAMLMAEATVVWLESNPSAFAELLGCDPQQVSWACADAFVARFGRRVLRRPLEEAELARFTALAGEDPTPLQATDAAIVALLQDPEFLYQVEIGRAAGEPEYRELTSWELATRLAFVAWGRGPDETLLDWAAAHPSPDTSEIRDVAAEMLSHPRAVEHALDHHAMWLGFDHAAVPSALSTDMLRETSALIERVVFTDDAPWSSLFDAPQTFVSRDLADHYALAWPGGNDPRWLADPTGRRVGLLGHAAILAQGSKFGDTSPTARGLLVHDRLLCAQFAPPAGTNIDVPPAADESACKPARYETLRVGECAGCHGVLDPAGLGLENFDASGRWRTHESDRPECSIESGGEIAGLGSFDSPAELGVLLRSSSRLRHCAVTNVYRFAFGRSELDAIDRSFIDRVDAAIDPVDYRYTEIVLAVVTSPGFRQLNMEADR